MQSTHGMEEERLCLCSSITRNERWSNKVIREISWGGNQMGENTELQFSIAFHYIFFGIPLPPTTHSSSSSSSPGYWGSEKANEEDEEEGEERASVFL